MSTAYPPRFVRYMFSSFKERDAARTASMTPGFYGEFPTSFGLYYTEPGTDFLSQYFHLGVGGDAESPRRDHYAVTFHKGPMLVQMTLYATSTHGSSPLIVARNERVGASSVNFTLPPEAGSGGGMNQFERLKWHSRNLQSFTLGEESFEWRSDTSKKPIRRRLIRVGGPESSQAGSSKEIETLATWTEGSVPNVRAHGRLAVFTFSNGAVESFGQYWALVAVASAVSICQQGTAIDGTMSWSQEKMLEDAKYTEDGTRIASGWTPHKIEFRDKDDPMMGKTKRGNPLKYSNSGTL